jgi:hypothetical protein
MTDSILSKNNYKNDKVEHSIPAELLHPNFATPVLTELYVQVHALKKMHSPCRPVQPGTSFTTHKLVTI